MMKFFTPVSIALIFTLSFVSFQNRAQNYTLNATSGTFTPNSAGTNIDVIEVDEALSGTLPIGFNFDYFGTTYTQFKVSSNGYLTFDLTETGSDYFNDLDFNGDLFIAPLWDDLNGTGGTATYQLTGTTGSQVLTIEWLNFRWDYTAGAAGISFQLKLYEATDAIEFLYRQEAGSLISPSASIGFTTSTYGNFYALSDATAAPTLAPNGNDGINQKPANNQVYTFTPAAAPVAPTVAANSITTPTVTASGLTINWVNGNGSYRAVFMKQTAAAEMPPIVDDVSYTGNTLFENGDYAGSGWYCVYNGTGSSVVVTGLGSDMSYRINVVEYNGLAGTQKYYTAVATNNPATATTLLAAPTVPISTIKMLSVSASTLTFEVFPGNGAKRAVFMRAATTGTASVVDNTTYTANTVFGSGTQVGTSGWFCVANGADPSVVTVTGLAANTAYLVYAVDYNGSTPGAELYNATTVTDNPAYATTFPGAAGVTYTLSSTASSFSALSGGTAIDDIEGDDVLSSAIPIGFPFTFSGATFTTAFVSSNGVVSFNPFAANVGSSSINNLESGLLRPAIAPLWDDLSGSAGQASYATTGTAPNRTFTIQFLNWKWYFGAANPSISFQVILKEATQTVSFAYRTEAGAVEGPAASIGIALPETDNFISLQSSTASPATSTSSEEDGIATRPATGQLYTFTPSKQDQTITFGALSNKTFGDAAFSLGATSSSTLPVSYSSSNTSIATVSGSTVTIVGAGGPVTITASQAGNGAYNAATPVQQSFSVAKANQTISFSKPADKVYGSGSFTLEGTSSSGLALDYTSSNTSVAVVGNGGVVNIIGAGTTDITASQVGNANYLAATAVVRSLTVTKGTQVVTFSELSPKIVGDASFDLSANSNSGLPITFTSSNENVATVAGATVTIVGAGTTEITATQSGNANFLPASVIRELFVKNTQTITFNSIVQKTFGDEAFTISATSSSQLPVSFAVANTSVATIEGNTITIVGAGTTDITATQSGNNSFAPAASVTRSLVVAKANQTISFTAVSTKTMGDAPFTVTVSSSSGLPIALSGNGGITLNGKQVTLVSPGLVTLTATQGGDTNYNSATPVSITFCVNPTKPIITVASQSPSGATLNSSISNGNQWYKDNQKIEGATGSSFVVSESGTYTVIASIGDCGSVPSDGKVVVIVGLEPTDGGIKIYPNPVGDELVIDLTGAYNKSAAVVRLYDVSGKQVNESTGSGVIRLNTSAHPQGNYLLKIQNAEGTFTKQVHKK